MVRRSDGAPVPPATGHYPYQVGIDAYGNGGFRFAGMSHHGSLLCLPGGMTAWRASLASDITLEALAPVLDEAEAIEVLLIGLGPDIAPLDPAIRAAFRERGVIIEAIATGGAVRTYNVLFGEGRPVGAALIAVERPR